MTHRYGGPRGPTLRRRALLAAAWITALAAVASATVGVTLARFSATRTGGSTTFAAGTVVVGAGTPASVVCTVGPMWPNESSSGYTPSGTLIGTGADAPCTFNVAYTGSVQAWLAVDVQVAQPVGATGPFYDGTATGVQLLVRDTASTFVSGTSYTNQSGVGTTLAVTAGAGSVVDLLVKSTPATSAFTDAFSIDYLLPVTSPNGAQGTKSTVILTFHAVQAPNNPLPPGPSPPACAPPRQCVTGMAWS